jgi:hypothetical protein
LHDAQQSAQRDVDIEICAAYYPPNCSGEKPMSVPSASRLFPFLFILIALLFVCVSSVVPQSDTAAPWNVKLNAEDTAPSTVTATNQCSAPHMFKIQPDHLQFMTLKGEATFQVAPKSQHVVPVEFNTHGMKPGSYDAMLTVRCMDCKTEATCHEDHQDLHVFLTVVTPPPANWTKVQPDQKGSVTQNPALLWVNIWPNIKPSKQ